MIVVRVLTSVALIAGLRAGFQGGTGSSMMNPQFRNNQDMMMGRQTQMPGQFGNGENMFRMPGQLNAVNKRGINPVPSQSFKSPQAFGSVASATTRQKIDWYKDIGDVFWRAGYYRGLGRTYDVVRGLRVPHTSPEYKSWMSLMQKLDGRISLAQPLMINQNITDRMALEVTDILLTQGYPEARDRLKRLRLEGSLMVPSDDMNALTLSIAIIKFETIYNNKVVPLWELDWKMTLREKIIGMTFATDVRKGRSTVLEPQIPYGHAVYARLMLIMGQQDIETLARLPKIAGDPVESNRLRGYDSVMKGNFCAGIRYFNEAAKHATPDAATEIATKVRKWQGKCKEKETSKTYTAFCQFGTGTEFPISDAAKGEPNARTVFSNERLFWTAIWAGDCRVAIEQLDQLKRSVSQSLIISHPIVNTRVTYMEQTLTECNANNRGTFDSAVGQQVLAALRADNSSEALRVAEAANDQMLMFAALVFRFPKAAYSPCMGGAVITGVADLPTLQLVHSISQGKILPDCGYANDECNYRQLQAFYISGSLTDAKRLAAMMDQGSRFCRPTVQMLGCMELCTDPNNKKNMSKAVGHFNKLLETSQAQPALKIAKQLAEKLLRAPAQSPVVQSQPKPKPAGQSLKNDIPLPSIRQQAPALGSCPPKPCGSNGFPCPTATQTPTCQCQAQPPTTCQPVAPAPVQQQPRPVTKTQPTTAQPCNCATPPPKTDAVPTVPNNPKTGKPWTPEEVKESLLADLKKQEEEAIKLAEPIINKKVAEVCEKNKKLMDSLVDGIKNQFHCPECEKAMQASMKADAIALAKGLVPTPAAPAPVQPAQSVAAAK